MNQAKTKKSKFSRQSFTLIELVMAVSIFTIIVIVGLATALVLSRNQNKSSILISTIQAGQQGMERVANIVQDSTALNIDSTNGLSLTVSSPPAITFSLYNNSNANVGQTCPDGQGPCYLAESGNTAKRVTPPEVTVNRFVLTGVSSGSPSQAAYVTIDMEVQSIWATTEPPLMLHTSIVPIGSTGFHP